MKKLQKLHLKKVTVMSVPQMKLITGGYDESDYDWCNIWCFCINDDYEGSEPIEKYSGPCSNAPWDRNPNCSPHLGGGLQNCYLVSRYPRY